ncbi:aminopeptidase [Sporosarcina sp. Marseille-Q4063]|uniref:aminopeptidase n=1 Tax=Sporosarcina sp. Marseille-Q4063 TaxID=2810514 RepID=UPI001BAE84DC|nr:aminopeptidase [Sporosarcina sp. Marseille-Q4063]QUW21110.1 aminopeptidase [Sporosarcina sp. Marseille-Q4063]
MRIENIIPDFLVVYESNQDFRMTDLEKYINKHPDIFKQYFPNHCPKTEERLQMAINKYPTKIDDIRMISEQLPTIIKDVEALFNKTFKLDMALHYKLIVGTFGSNAFVTRDNKREIYFAVEKLSADIEHLKVIVAHEIGHVAHFSFATNQDMDWTTVDWMHGLTTLYTEGAATYLSEKIVPDLNESVYFTYDDEGDSWVKCYEVNKTEVKRRFLEDVSNGWNMAKEKEWFRLSGGNYFGHNRLGYLLGTDYVEQLVDRVGEEEALTFWVENDVKKDILAWLDTK